MDPFAAIAEASNVKTIRRCVETCDRHRMPPQERLRASNYADQFEHQMADKQKTSTALLRATLA